MTEEPLYATFTEISDFIHSEKPDSYGLRALHLVHNVDGSLKPFEPIFLNQIDCGTIWSLTVKYLMIMGNN